MIEIINFHKTTRCKDTQFSEKWCTLFIWASCKTRVNFRRVNPSYTALGSLHYYISLQFELFLRSNTRSYKKLSVCKGHSAPSRHNRCLRVKHSRSRVAVTETGALQPTVRGAPVSGLALLKQQRSLQVQNVDPIFITRNCKMLTL
jgi:hypothetical protein